MIRNNYHFVWIYVVSVIPHVFPINFLGLKVNYIQNLCTANNNGYLKVGSVESGVESSGILTIKNLNSWYVNKSTKCNITLIPPNTFTGITISVYDIKLDLPIEVIISNGSASTTLRNKENSTLEDVISTSSKPGMNVTISFSSIPTVTSRLKMIYTAYYKNTNCLSSSEFHCGNDHCIAKLFECDGYNHCGDYSAQRYCHLMFYMFHRTSRILRIIFLTFTILILGFLFTCVFLYFFLKHYGRYRRQQGGGNFAYQDSPYPPASPLIPGPYGVNSPYMEYPNVPPPPPYMSQKSPGYQPPLATILGPPPPYTPQKSSAYQPQFATEHRPPPGHQQPQFTTEHRPPPGYQPLFSNELLPSPGCQSPFAPPTAPPAYMNQEPYQTLNSTPPIAGTRPRKPQCPIS